MPAGLLTKLTPSQDAAQLARARLSVWDAWRTPLPGDDGVGRDPGIEDAFFEVKDEAGRLSGIDDAKIIRACERWTKEAGKDLRVTTRIRVDELRRTSCSIRPVH